ncbi:hypothetical protein HZA56_18090 [Candidatus Poribacteria bacterium]|nr:hypothetical protein [Candidatus Poribacteria bacterium]
MAKFSFNPIKWFRRKRRPPQPAQSNAPASLKAPVQPRKSGDLFMQLITVQKNLQSMELAVRQQIDTSWLVQKTSNQMATLKRQAETVGEEELAQAAGQLSAYFETVSEGRLVFSEEGVALVREFVAIFKDAIGDAAPGIRMLDHGKLESWNWQYQALMAQMKPIEETQTPAQGETATLERAAHNDTDAQVGNFSIGETEQPSVVKDDAEKGLPKEIYDPALNDLVAGKPDFAFPKAEDFSAASPSPGIESVRQDELSDTPSVDSLPPYDPTDEARVRDVVISDSEIRSPRGRMDSGHTVSTPSFADRGPGAQRSVAPEADPPKLTPGKMEAESVKSPVQLEEVERLKRKLFDLHEEQETLSWRMNGILGGLKKAVKSEQAAQSESTRADGLDTQEMEDIIFIGRKKG